MQKAQLLPFFTTIVHALADGLTGLGRHTALPTPLVKNRERQHEACQPAGEHTPREAKSATMATSLSEGGNPEKYG